MIIWHSTGWRKVWEGFIGWLNFRQRVRYTRSSFSWRCEPPVLVRDFVFAPWNVRLRSIPDDYVDKDELFLNTVERFKIKLFPYAPFVSIEPDTRVKP